MGSPGDRLPQSAINRNRMKSPIRWICLSPDGMVWQVAGYVLVGEAAGGQHFWPRPTPRRDSVMGSTSMKRPVRLLAGTISVAVGFAVMPALAAVAAPAARLASTPHSTQGKQATLGAPRKVNLKALSGVPAGAHPHLVAPFLSAHTEHATSAPWRAGATVLRASAPQAARTAITAFPVMSLARQFGIFGPDQLLQPPDTQLAAGPAAGAAEVQVLPY